MARRRSRESHPTSPAKVGWRIAEVAELFGTQKEAAAVAGVSLETLDRYKKSETGLKFDPIVRLTAAKGVSLDWLATGEGPMLQSDRTTRDSSNALARPRDGYIALPRYDVQAAAGAGM